MSDQLPHRPPTALDEELERMAEQLLLDEGRELSQALMERRVERTVEAGRPMALLSYFSVLFGLPVFVVPMVLRDNAFALHHARAAGAIYVASLVALALSLTQCAVFLPFVFLCYIPAAIGIYRAAAGVEAGRSALEPWGRRLFGRIEVET